MSLTNFKGAPALLTDILAQASAAPSLATTLLIDASTEKACFLGCVWHPTQKTGTLNIRKVHCRLGAVTFNAASVLRVSLQNISQTAGPVYQPDGVQDQTADMTALTANAWNTTGNLSADRAVDLSAVNQTDANSRWLAVVFEFQTFTAADSIVVSAINPQAAPMNGYMGGGVLLNTGTWALQNSAPILALECDDGTFAFIKGGYPALTFSSASVASNGAIRAAGLKFRFPVETKIEGLALGVVLQNGADGTLILYGSDGTTALVSVGIDNDAVANASLLRNSLINFPPVTLAANTYYRWVFVASTTTAATVHYLDVNTAALMDGFAGGQDFHWTQRDSAGVWTDTTTRRPLMGVELSAVHDGTGGGLALPVSGRICA